MASKKPLFDPSLKKRKKKTVAFTEDPLGPEADPTTPAPTTIDNRTTNGDTIDMGPTTLHEQLKRHENLDDELEEGEDKKDKDDELNGEISLPHSSSFLATGGYDGYVKIWSADDWQILRSMHADNKIMSVDVHPDGDMLASGDWGRTFKLWGAL